MANGKPWVDAPVFVDAIANERETPIVRVTYLTIECVEPAWGWSLSIHDAAIPIGLLGLSAVVLGPFDDARFRLPSQFDDLIAAWSRSLDSRLRQAICGCRGFCLTPLRLATCFE